MNYSKNYRKITGFTLAEVLVTLGIIGVVAAMTIPTLLNNINDSQYKTAYRKAYSALSQAFLSAKQNGDIIPLTGTYSSQGMETDFAALQNQFKVIKSCASSGTEGCWDTTGEQWRGELFSTQGFIDSSGMTWKLRNKDTANVVPVILVDTNGFKKPNVYGKDRFPLLLNNGIDSDPWKNINLLQTNSTELGMPTRISPLKDIPPTSNYGEYDTMCPSYASSSCYFTTWLLGD